MQDTPIRLDNRVVLSISGTDAETFLQGVLTNDMTSLSPGQANYSALLTPQGKITCDGLFLKTEEGFLVDTPIQADEALLKKLNMLKLRADVKVELRDDLSVFVFAEKKQDNYFTDPRHNDLPGRAIAPSSKYDETHRDAWDGVRIACCVPEFGFDFGEGEVFPADVNMDLIDGVDFKKGCFIGQEVVSRMKRKGTVRRRTVPLKFERGAPDRGSAIYLDDVLLGEVTSQEDQLALARLRLDRLVKARQHQPDQPLVSLERNAEMVLPPWLKNELQALKD